MIGEISSFLNTQNIENFEFEMNKRTIESICSNNGVDDRVQAKAIRDLLKNTRINKGTNIDSLKQKLSTKIYMQLEISTLNDYIESFKLFKSLNDYRAIRYLKEQSILDD